MLQLERTGRWGVAGTVVGVLQHRLSTEEAAEGLGAAVAHTASDRILARRIMDVENAFARELKMLEGPKGLFADVLKKEPRLVPAIERLRKGSKGIVRRLLDLGAAVVSDEPPDAGMLRRAVDDIRRRLDRHARGIADLVHEAFVDDLGTGD